MEGKLINLPTVSEKNGSLTYYESGKEIPFDIKNVSTFLAFLQKNKG